MQILYKYVIIKCSNLQAILLNDFLNKKFS
jgi:hypothetical protein